MTWRTQRVREMASLLNGHPFDSADFSAAGEVPLVRIRDILATEFETFVPEARVPATALVRNGDVLIGMDGDFNVALWNRGDAALNQRVCLLRTDGRADPRFLAYALPDHLRVINDLTYSTTVKHLSSWQVLHLSIEAPDVVDQRAIADYLDQETAQIDALVTKQEEFIGLLRERYDSVVRTETSQFEGPYRIDKLGRSTRVGNGSTPKRDVEGYWDKGEVPWLTSTAVNSSEVKSAEQFITERAVTECHLPVANPGDLLIGLIGQGPTRGKATICRIRATLSQNLAYISPDNDKWISEYLLWNLRAKYSEIRQKGAESGAAQGMLNTDDIRRIRVAMPSLTEQKKVVTRLEKKTSRIEVLINKAEEHIALAMERRSALITAAVTGQFDVRTAKKGARF